MDFILLVGKFIGAAIVAVVIVVLLAIFGFRFWISRMMKKTMGALSQDMPIINQPRVKLTAYRGETAHQAMIDQLIHEAEYLGFHLVEPNHLFETDLPAGIYVYFLQNSNKTQHIAIYDSEQLEKPMIDMMQCYQDKTICGVSNSPFASLPYPSNVKTEKLPPETSLTELLHYMSTEFSQEGIFAVQGEKLSSIIEQLYAMQQDYLIHLNFADYAYAKSQVDKFAHDNPKKKQSPEELQDMIQMIQDNMREGYEHNIPFVVQDRFLKENKMDAAQWQEYESNLVIVHERQTAETLWEEHFQNYFIEYVHNEKEDDWVDKPLVDEAVMAQLNDLKDRYIHRPFDYVNAVLPLLPKERQFKKLGGIKYPINADLYYFA